MGAGKMAYMLLAAVLLLPSCAWPQLLRDTVLFTLELRQSDQRSVRSCERSDAPSGGLSGPVVMAGSSLLLWSSRGYLLLDSSGTVLDSHAVSEQDAARGLKLAYPIDSLSLLYYSPSSGSGRPVKVFRKRLFDPFLGEITDREYRSLGAVHVGTFVNIACNAITSRRTVRLSLEPQLVGFTGLDEGERWWALDRDANLFSPLLYRRADGGASLYAGLFQGEGVRVPRGENIELRGSFAWEGRRCYLGALRQTNLELPRCSQYLYTCDEAGNVLHLDTVLGQENADMVVGLTSEGGENIVAVMRDAARMAFPPVADGSGRVYYGIMDYEHCAFSVRRRAYMKYRPVPFDAAAVTGAFAAEQDLAYERVPIRCNPSVAGGAQIPRVSYTGPGGVRRVATIRELERDGYIARIGRRSLRDLSAKLGRRGVSLPTAAQRLRDSLVAALPEADCPYVVSLSGPGGYVRTFAYGAGEAVLCARVLGVRPDSAVAVRVDQIGSAEILLFTSEGAFVNRFTFNRQPWSQRRDLVVLTRPSRTAAVPDGLLVEWDFEQSPDPGAAWSWLPDTERQ
jgi:hypothetical protein